MIRSAGCVSRQFLQFTPRRLHITRNKSRIFTYHFCQDLHISRRSFHLWTILCRQESRRYSPTVSQFIRTIHSTRTLCNEDQIVRTPPFAESVTEGDVRWAKEVGDYVEVDEVVAEIETDKTSITVSAPVSGVIEELFVPDGEKVVAGQELCRIKTSAKEAASTSEPKRDIAPDTPPTETPPTSPPPTSPPPTPAASAGPIPSSPPPEPPLPSKPSSSVSTESVALPSAPGTIMMPATDTSAARTETRVKMNRMRRRIAQRLKDAQNTCAMLTTFNELDMSNVMEMRKTYKDAFLKTHGIKLGFMSAFIKASAHALKQLPAVNGAIDDTEIVYRDYVDISVAVATPKGLVVPVIRNVENMNYADIEIALNEVGEKARTGNLAVEDMDGGTFTISNGGVFGSLMGTPIINPPQSAILGMHGIFDRPVAVNGKVEIRPMMYIALTYDHRLIDGREGVMFLRSVKASVEDPRQLLLDL